ncbi:MAG: C45 family autoproteolytic acyltransferase/hydrolase [Candidatus Aminicenantes bacterium]|jgi:hypothetical protein
MQKKANILGFLLPVLLCFSIHSFGFTKLPEDKDVLPPSILPVIILSGSDYDMGFQYGQQAGHFIVKTSEAKWAESLQRFSRDEILHALKANQHYIKKYTPEIIEQMKGMADGARKAGFSLAYSDILLINCTLPKPETSTYPAGAEKDSLPPKKCSVCSAWGTATKDGRLIGVDTLDSSEVPYAVVIAAYPEKGNSYICGADAGEIGDHFLMNNKGLFLGNSGGGGSPRDIDSNYGLSWSCSLPHLARFSRNAVEAKDMVLGWQINIPENFHFVDIHGNAFVVEKTAAVQSVRQPGDFSEKDFLFSTNNYLNEAMKVTKKGEFIKQHGGYGAYAAPRNMMLWDMLHNYHGQIDTEFAKMMLRFPGNPPPYPPEGGWDAKICRPTNLWTAVVCPDDGDRGVAHICTGPVGRVLHSSIASDETIMLPTYQYMKGTHSFYRLTLAATPEKMVLAAKKTASKDIAAAYGKLMFLEYTAPGYAFLQNLYGLAVKEFFQGRNAFNRGLLAEGNERLTFLAEAATAFTRSQAHAQQVYEALVPPPTSPSDLGLRPFGGDWAEWETRVEKNKLKILRNNLYTRLNTKPGMLKPQTVW